MIVMSPRRLTLHRTLALAVVALLGGGLGLGLTGCFKTPKPECGLTCGTGGTCPTDYTCGTDNRCRLTSLGNTPCTEVFDARAADAAFDAAFDAGPTFDARACELDLAPASDGSGHQELIVSEVSAGVFIELYNNTSSTITLDALSKFGLQAGTAQLFLNSSSPANLAIPAHSYATLDWPVIFTSPRIQNWRNGSSL